MKSFLAYLVLSLFSITLHSQDFDVYVSDAGNFNNPPWQILKFDSTGNNPVSFINSNLNWPQDILFMEDSNVVLISNLESNSIARFDAQTGAFLSIFASSISGPTRMKIGPDGLLYVLQWSGNGLVKRYELNGNYVDDFTAVSVTQSIGLDWDQSGNLYVSSYNGDHIRKFDTAGVDLGLFVNSNLAGPTNIWFDNLGQLFVSDYDGASLKRFDSIGAFLGVYISGLANSEGIAHLPNGNLLVGNGATHSVKMYDPTGLFIQDFIANGSGSLLTPNAVVIRFKENISIEEEKEVDIDFIFPNMGSLFQVEDDFGLRASGIEIRDEIGRLIYNSEILNWDANSIPEGFYLATLIFKDGQKLNQKIQVKKK